MKLAPLTLVCAPLALFAVGPTSLELSRPIDARLAAGESHDYQLTVQSGQYARVEIDQRNVNVSVTLFAPDGKQIFSSDAETIGEIEPAEFIAESTGNYRLRLAPSEPNAPAGQYSVTWITLAPAGPRYRSSVAGAREFAAAMSSYLEGTRDSILRAIEHTGLALAAWRGSQDHAAESRALLTLAVFHAEAGNRDQAFEFANQALPVAQNSHDPLAEARALDALGQVHFYFGDRRKAIAYFEQALPLMRAAGRRAAYGATLSNLGVAYSRTGDKHRALECFDEATAIFRELQDRKMLSDVLNNMGLVYDDLGEYQKALDNHLNALGLRREINNRAAEAVSWNNIGGAYGGLAIFQEALDAYHTALDLNRAAGNQWNVSINLNNIAWVHGELADPLIALAFYKESLAIVRKIDDRHGIAVALNNIGEIYADLGDHRKAAAFHQEALPLRRAEGDVEGEANSLNNLGKAYANLGDRVKARDSFEQALGKLRSNGNRYMLARTLRNLGELDSENSPFEEALAISRAIHDSNGEAAALARLARLARDRGNLAEAHRRAEEAMTAVESVRLAVASPKLRASYLASARELQELNIEVLIRLHSDAEALLAAERGRARSLLEMLPEGAAEIRRGADESLLTRERQLEQLIAAKAAKHTESKELDALTVELDQVQSRIRTTSPHYAALTQPSPLNLKQIQPQVLDPETVLLEYFLGPRKSYLWLVSQSSIETFELPARSEIESAARRVYNALTARPRNPEGESSALKTASSILLAPVTSKIKGKRLLIVAEGVLQYLPFAALPDPSAPSFPLIANHEIVTAPSASVLAVLRNETAGRAPAPKTVAVFADPVFGAQFLPLRFSRAEADGIARLAPPESTLKVVGSDATREAALRPDIGQYRIVHFATHSVLDNQRPELSGIVLSLYDRAGRPQNGFLRLYDIYNLRLGADLVVLSACQTALGGEIKGEGLIGLTRGFLYAGAPRVVATLWEVDDRTTSELMKHFYAGVLSRGERPAAALRAAQLAMWRTKGWDAPYYWGAFTIAGEWR